MSPGTRTFSMIHTSDVHIGWTKGDGADHLDVCLCPVHGVVDVVRSHEADVLLVAGDLFDHARLSNEVIGQTLDVLASCGVPVVLIPGNHDVLDGTSLWHRAAGEVVASGVHLLDAPEGSQIELFEGDLTIWCQAMEEHHPGYQPLADVPGRPDSGWWVVAGHGHHEAPDEGSYRSSPILADEIARTEADYVALGHWHIRTDVSAGGVPAWYPGAPMGSVTSGTANLTKFGPSGVSVEHVAVHARLAGCA
ncbi:MAG: metallophosphoesterase family protein [Acidimicrobiales bacterium]|jgi:exonuclease SbcD